MLLGPSTRRRTAASRTPDGLQEGHVKPARGPGPMASTHLRGRLPNPSPLAGEGGAREQSAAGGSGVSRTPPNGPQYRLRRLMRMLKHIGVPIPQHLTERPAKPLILPLASLGAPPAPARGEGFGGQLRRCVNPVGARAGRGAPVDAAASKWALPRRGGDGKIRRRRAEEAMTEPIIHASGHAAGAPDPRLTEV